MDTLDLLPFYALGSLSDDEKANVDAYLEDNPTHYQQLNDMLEVVFALSFSADPINPPSMDISVL